MLEFFRRQSKLIMIAVTVVIVIAFVFWSGNTRPSDPGVVRPEDTAMSVHGREYSFVEAARLQRSYTIASQLGLPGVLGRGGFANEIIGMHLQYRNSNTGMPLTYEEVPMDYCVNLLVLRDALQRYGIRASDAEAKEYFRRLPAFNENGQFNPETAKQYLQMIGSRGFREDDIYEVLRDAIGFQRVFQIVAGNVVSSPAMVERYYAGAFSTIKAATIPFPLEDYKKKVEVAPEEIKTYYEEKKAGYKSDEKRAVTLVVFPRPDDKGKDAEAKVKADQAYNEMIQKFSEKVLTPNVNLEAEATATKEAEIRPIATFAMSAPPEEFKEETDLVDAIFNNDPERLPISDPIPTKKGYAFFKVTKIEEPKQQELKEVEAKVREVLVIQKATVAMTKAANDARAKLEAAIKGGKKFEEAAKEAGLTPQNVAEFSAVNPPPDLADGYKFGGAAQFTAPGNFAKEVIETENGLVLLYVVAKELRKSEESAATRLRVATSLDGLARQDVFRMWFERARTDAAPETDALFRTALGQAR